MHWNDLLGHVAAALTTFCFLPQLIRTWRSRSARDLSVAMLFLFSIGVAFWLIYGIRLRAWPIIWANAVTLVLAGAVLGLAFQFQRKPRRGIIQLDHLVLTVRSPDKTIDFYSRILGMREETFGEGRKALHFGTQKLNLHPADRVLDINVKHATPGSADLCFLVAGPLEEWVKAVSDQGIKIVLGPVARTGAQGPLRSIYFYDPDENLLELAMPMTGAQPKNPSVD